jgi:hypothetical protein
MESYVDWYAGSVLSATEEGDALQHSKTISFNVYKHLFARTLPDTLYFYASLMIVTTGPA